MAGDKGAPEEQGSARPRLTFYPPPQSRQLIELWCGAGGPSRRPGAGGPLTGAGGPSRRPGAGGPLTGAGGTGPWTGLGTPLHPAVGDTKPLVTWHSSADPTLDVDSASDKRSLPKPPGRASCHTLLLLQKKVTVSAPPHPDRLRWRCPRDRARGPLRHQGRVSLPVDTSWKSRGRSPSCEEVGSESCR